jgi:hypothetical protein
MIKFSLLFLIFICSASWAQIGIQKRIHGKILADFVAVEGINVLNLVSEKKTVTDKNGEFFILAKAEDLLVLTAVNLEIRRKLIEEEDLKMEVIIIKMIPKITVLKEVKVNENSHINAVNLGIVPKGQKTYTPAERRLYTATTGGGIVPIDPILNWISGRTAMLKKELEVEKKEKLLLKFDGLFEDKLYVDNLKIPKEYIKGFQYYLIEDAEFVKALLAKNKTLMLYLIPRLAVNYNQIITYGN